MHELEILFIEKFRELFAVHHEIGGIVRPPKTAYGHDVLPAEEIKAQRRKLDRFPFFGYDIIGRGLVFVTSACRQRKEQATGKDGGRYFFK